MKVSSQHPTIKKAHRMGWASCIWQTLIFYKRFCIQQLVAFIHLYVIGARCVTTYIHHFGIGTNSGVQNYMYYLLVAGGEGTNDNGAYYSVKSFGLSTARAIAYRVLTQYLTTNSTYSDARNAWVQATADFFGPCNAISIAAKQITIYPGFVARNGAVFHASINECWFAAL